MSLRFDNGGILVESLEELPELEGDYLFLDLETTSFSKQDMSINPWHKCWVLGIAVKVDDSPAYYVPLNHATDKSGRFHNLDPQAVQAWLLQLLRRIKIGWVNHNVKYDAQVLYNSFGVNVSLKKFDTVDLAKMIDSDRFHYNLGALSFDWLHEDIEQYEAAFKPYLKKNKDYGYIPIDLMAEYACQDVITEKRLWEYIQANMPEDSKTLAATSSDLVDCLIDIERNGMRINPQQVKTEMLLAMNEMIQIQSEIAKEIGYTIEPHVAKDCHDVLCNHFGLPVLEYSEAGNPSFDKHILEQYKALPNAPVQMIEQFLKYRRLQTFVSVFCNQYLLLHKEGLLHCSYNATVRTGRMSCSLPNMQQLMMEAKKLIIPDEDGVILSVDYSQIEFRVIVHYINDEAAVKAYNENPWTDFHTWVAETCGVHRKPAKTINFLMGYGGGKAKLVDGLTKIPELVGEIWDKISADESLSPEDKVVMFTAAAVARGEQVYKIYHNTLPGLKRVSKQAMNKIYDRGYVINKYGRHRRLPTKVAFRAFNTLCQGTSADMMKERLVALWDWLKRKHPNVKPIGCVHDEVVLRCPKSEISDELLDSICFILEDIQTELRIPIRTSIGISEANWYEASESDENRMFDREEFKKKFSYS